MSRVLNARPLWRFVVTATLATLAMCIIALVNAHAALADNALACPPAANGINSIPNSFCLATGGWLKRAQTAAQSFFFTLVAIELAWSAILYVLQKDNLGELLATWLVKLMAIYFFLAIIMNANVWLPAIMSSFMQLGNQVTAQAVPLDPQAILQTGLDFCSQLFTKLPQANFPGWEGLGNISGTIADNLAVVFCMLVSVIFAGVVTIIIFASFLIVAGQLMMTMIEAYIMISAGAVMLGFMGSRWTMSWGEKYIGYAVSIGIKLFVTFVILGLGATLTQSWGDVLNDVRSVVFSGPDQVPNLAIVVLDYLTIGAAAIVYMMLVMKLPGLASSMMNGSPSLSMGGAMSTGAAVAGAVTGIAAGVASAVGGALSKAGSAASSLADAGAAGDKLSALAKQSAVDKLEDSAAGAAGDLASDAAIDGAEDSLGDAAQDALADGAQDALSDGADGAVADGADDVLGDGAPDAMGDGADIGDASETHGAVDGDDALADDTPMLDAEGSEIGSETALALTDEDAAAVAESDSAIGTSGATPDAASAKLDKAKRAARDSERTASKSGAQRERSRARSDARGHAFDAVASLASGGADSASSAMRLVTELNEGSSDGAAHVSLRMPE